jgi:hypothetical protein
MAAQKAVEQLVSKRLLDKSDINQQVQEIKKEAQGHQTLIEKLCERKSDEQNIDFESVKSIAAETEQKASKMMSTYLGNDADTSEA